MGNIVIKPTQNHINVRIVPTETTISAVALAQNVAVKSEVKPYGSNN